MSNLKTHNLQSPDAASVNIALAPNNGMVVAGISTFNNRVLIGTNIEGHADADDLTIGSSTNTAGITIRTNTAGTGRLFFSDGTSGAAEIQGYVQYDHNSQILALGSGGSTTLQIDQSGNVYFLGSQTGNNRGVIYNHASAFGIYASAHSGTDREIRFYSNFTSGSERLRITSGGHVNIGGDYSQTSVTAQITGDLLVQKTASAYLNPNIDIYNYVNGGYAGSITFSGKIGGSKYSQARIRAYGGSNTSDGALAIETGNMNEKLRIDSSGNVMINRTSSGKKFSVREGSSSSGVYYNAHIGGASHLANYAVGIGFDPEGYSARTKIGIVAEGTSTGYSRGKLHFLLDNANDSGEATLSEARMTINDSGQVTKPNQPSFAAYAAQNGYTISSTFPFNATRHNIGSHFNTGNYRFTAPVAGKYLFTFTSILASSVTNGYYSIRVNGSGGKGQYVHVTKSNSNWNYCANSWIFNLNANDYVTMYSDSSLNWHGNDWQLFCGELLS